MPYESKKQEAFFHTPAGEAKVGKKNVQEFDEASKGMKLPEKAPAPPVPQAPQSNRLTDMMKGVPL